MNRLAFLRSLTGGLAFAALLTSAGCGEEQTIAPPDLRYGEDVCAECNMIISDDRYAAAMVVDVDGRYEHRAFDDIGCMLGYEAAPSERVLREYVRDYAAHEWLDVEDAVYLHSASLQTPMAFGVAAFSNRDAAASLAETYSGTILDNEALRARFEAGELGADPFAATPGDDND